jgi:N-methylhydantoinase A
LIVGIGKIEGRIGIDIRDFTILAYGGAGPTHACLLADELGIKRIVVPLSPGTFCALGSLSADFRMDFVQTVNVKMAAPNWSQIRAWFNEKEREAAVQLEQERELIEAIVAVRSVDARFEGQGFNTEVPVSEQVLEYGDNAGLTGAFHARYKQLYDVMQADVPGELVNIRLTVIGRRKQYVPISLSSSVRTASPVDQREVYFDGRRRSVPIFRRSDLSDGVKLSGPCIVDQADTTTFIKTNWDAEVDVYGFLHLIRN